jgi:hypothetical protein
VIGKAEEDTDGHAEGETSINYVENDFDDTAKNLGS